MLDCSVRGRRVSALRARGAIGIFVALIGCGSRSGLELELRDRSGGAATWGGAETTGGGQPAQGGVAGAPFAGAGGVAVGSGREPSTLKACSPSFAPAFNGPLARAASGRVDAAVSGDWNQDGASDLATANSNGSVSVFLGDGTGNLTLREEQTTFDARQTSARSVIASGDLNDDGRLDLVVAAANSQTLSVLLSRGDGTFQASVPQPLPADAAAVLTSDITGDGRVDVVVAVQKVTGAPSVLVFPSNRDGTLGSAREIWSGNRVQAMQAGDMNQDNRMDLVVATQFTTYVLLGTESGQFTERTNLPTGRGVASVLLGDWNKDGKLDLAAVTDCSVRSGIEIRLGQGDGTFFSRNRIEIENESCLGPAAVGDLNGDGEQDIAGSSVQSFLGEGNSGFEPSAASSDALIGWLLALDDWNQDGRLDAAVAVGNHVAVHLGNGDGTFGSAPTVPLTRVQQLALADLNGDGALDLAALRPRDDPRLGSQVTVRWGTGDGEFAVREELLEPFLLDGFAAGDIDGDRSADVVMAGDSIVTLFRAFHVGMGALAENYMTSSRAIQIVLADVNADMFADILTLHSSARVVHVLLGLGGGKFQQGSALTLREEPTSLTIADLNGDARADLLVADRRADSVTVHLGLGDGTFLSEGLTLTAPTPIQLAVADWNADTVPDIVIASVDSMSVAFGNGDGTFSAAQTYPLNARRVAAGDYNLDGRADILVENDGFEILFGAGDGAFSCRAAYSLGYPGQVVTGDVNGDGSLDVVVSTPHGATVFLNSLPRK